MTDAAARHVRTIRIETERASDDQILVRGTLLDQCALAEHGGKLLDIHQMEAVVRATRPPEVRIVEITGRMLTHPNAYCPEALASLAKLRGMTVAQGFTRLLQAEIGRERGCAHMTTLILAMAPAARQGSNVIFTPEAFRPSELQQLRNTCYVWREEGDLWARLLTGEFDSFTPLAQSILR